MDPLFVLDLTTGPSAVAIAQAACLAAAGRAGLAPDKRGRLELAVEEVVANAVDHAYPDGEAGRIRVSAAVEGAAFAVRVQDWGVPFDFAAAGAYRVEDPALHGLGLHLAWRCCDEAVFRNLGRDGKRFDLRFRLPPAPLAAAGAVPPAPAETSAEAPVEIQAARRAGAGFAIRPFAAADASGVARCAWLAYGYTKPDDHLYNPAELIRLNDAGVMRSLVAHAADGTILGHACLDFAANPHVPEATDLVIAPSARGNPRLLGSLMERLQEVAADLGPLGVLVNAVTAHTVSQRAALRCGGVPVHVHLASVSTDWQVGPGAATGAARQSEVVFYGPMNPGPRRTIHVPERHRALVQGMVDAIGEPATLAPPQRTPVALPDRPTGLAIRSGLLHWGVVVVEVHAVGGDAVPVLAGFLRRFCADSVATVLLDLPLADPATATLGDAVERLGFSIAGILPHARGPGGDALLYQYLNNVAPDLAGERIAPACRPLYDHVVAERRRVETQVFGATFPPAAPDTPDAAR